MNTDASYNVFHMMIENISDIDFLLLYTQILG